MEDEFKRMRGQAIGLAAIHDVSDEALARTMKVIDDCEAIVKVHNKKDHE